MSGCTVCGSPTRLNRGTCDGCALTSRPEPLERGYTPQTQPGDGVGFVVASGAAVLAAAVVVAQVWRWLS